MKKIFIITAILLTTQIAFGQGFQIKGQIISDNNAPVEFANVVLQTADSVFVSGGISDQRGRFQMENIQAGQYNLHISSIGYESKSLELNEFNKNLDLGSIHIDSTSFALDEVTITASHIINQPDRKIVLPTARQLKASYNGLTLLQQLQLNRIHVDIMKKKITASGGGEVQLRLNGVKSSIQEISSLRPEDVFRVEFHDDPGLRYEGAAAVIDYITRRKDRGGYVSFDTQNSPHIRWGNNQVSAKINYKKSEFSTYYFGGYRSFNNMWRENTETFNFDDNTSLTRKEDGIPDKWSMYWHYLNFSYNYQEPDKYFFNASVRGNFEGEPKTYYNSILYPVNNPEQSVHMRDRSSSKSKIPSVDLYYQRNLKNKQTLILNVVGTYIDSYNERKYTEQRDNETLTDIFSAIDGNKYSVIGEGIYEKAFEKSNLSFGLKHTQSFSDNEYSGSTVSENKMDQSDTYAFAEYRGKINKFSYTVGIGGSRSWFKQDEKGYTNYNFRPTLRMTYNFNDRSLIRFRGSIYSNNPSLGDLSNTEQLIDSLQIRRGNPDLKPYTAYSNSLYYEFRKGLFNMNLNIGYWYYDKPIMEQVVRENNKFIRMQENQKSWQKLNPELEIKVGPIKDILNISVATGINHFESKGQNYSHTYTNWYYQMQAMAFYKNWSGMFMIQNHRNNFYGESLEYGENVHILGVTYRHKQLNVGVMALNPFSNNWKMGSENRSKEAPSKNWRYLKESSRAFAVTIAYNFSFGRKYESASKRLNNQDTDTGVMSGGK